MQIIKFEKNKEIFDSNLVTGIEISSNLTSNIANALINNMAINDIKLPFRIGDGNITISSQSPEVRFKNTSSISIDGSAKGGLRLGIYDKIDDALKDLEKLDSIKIELNQLEEDEILGCFSLTYALDGSIEGDWPLKGGKITFGVEGAHSKRMAVLMRGKKTDKSFDFLSSLVNEFKLLKHISSTKDLEDNTLIVLQTKGSISGKVGAQAGYDFNWLYKSDIPDLNGTLGLRAKLGAELDLGFNAAGNYAVILSKTNFSKKNKNQGNPAIRLQLYKQKENGLNFALGLAANVQLNTGENEDFNLDDILKATLGIHSSQILKVLNKATKISDPNKLTEEIEGFTKQELAKITGQSINDDFIKLRDKLKNILSLWNDLGENPTSTLWNILDENLSLKSNFPVDDILEDFKTIAQGDKDSIIQLMEEKISNVEFDKSEFGKLINSIIPSDDLQAIFAESKLFNEFVNKAKKIVNLLSHENGNAFKKFHDEISKELSLDKISDALENNNISDLGGWLAGQLSEFLVDESGNYSIKELEQIEEFIDKITDKNNVERIISKTRAALKKEYGISLAYSYQKEKETRALVDIEFCDKQGSFTPFFKMALTGNFDKIFTDNSDFVYIKNGIFTHRIKRERTISLSLPFMKRSVRKINEAISKGKYIEEAEGNLMMYEMESDDIIQRNKRLSHFALNATIHSNLFAGYDDSIKLSYSFKMAKRRFRKHHLEQILEPFINTYLPDELGKSYDVWISEIEKQIKTDKKYNKRFLGPTLLTLNLKIPATIGNAWLKLPTDIHSYDNISIAIQQKLRETLTKYFFSDETVYYYRNRKNDLYTILLYMSIPVKSDIKFKRRDSKLKYHWNYQETIDNLRTDKNICHELSKNIGDIHQKLSNSSDDELKKHAKKFENKGDILRNEIVISGTTNNEWVNAKLEKLFKNEEEIIETVIFSGSRLANYLSNRSQGPQKTNEMLTQFGGEITNAFNKYAASSIVSSKRDFSRYLGNDLFIAIAKELDPSISINTQGLLELLVLKSDFDFNLESYNDGNDPAASDLIISEIIPDLD